MKRKLICFVFLVSAMIYGHMGVSAQNNQITAQKFPVVMVAQSIIPWDEVIPVVIEKRTFVPVREFISAIGGSLNYFENQSLIKISFRGSQFTLDYKHNLIHTKDKGDVVCKQTILLHNRLYVMLIPFSDCLGFSGSYYQDNDKVLIYLSSESTPDIKDIINKNMAKIKQSQEKILARATHFYNAFCPKFTDTKVDISIGQEISPKLQVVLLNPEFHQTWIEWTLFSGEKILQKESSALRKVSSPFVKFNKPGEYTIVAKISTLLFEKEIKSRIYVKDPSIKPVYITIDDGPNKYTGEILDLLKKYKLKSTFFVILNKWSDMEIIKRTVKDGHAIGVHCNDHHADVVYKNDMSVVKQFNIVNNYLSPLGYQTKLARTPYGSVPKLTYNQYINIKKEGYRLWDWNIDSQDSIFNHDNKNLIVNKTISQLERTKNPIILFHGRSETLKALPDIFKYIVSKGYESRVLTEDMSEKNFFTKTI